jgi:hypothetical protein
MVRKWKTEGMEEPLVAPRPYAERGPVKQSQKGKDKHDGPKIDAMFGKVGLK